MLYTLAFKRMQSEPSGSTHFESGSLTDMKIVDAQVHIWAADRPDRPWPTGRPAKPHRLKPIGKEDLLAEMDAAGIDAAVLVPPSWEGERNDVVLEAARAHPRRLGVMGRLDVSEPDAPEALRRWREQRGMLGARFTFRLPHEVATLTEPEKAWIWEIAEHASIPLMLYPPGLLSLVDPIAERHPGLRLIIDHMALDRVKGPAAFARLPELLVLARRPNVGVKLSALPFYSSQLYPFHEVHEPIRRTYDAFGPERLFWGSDMSRLPCTYAEAVSLFTEELDWLSESDKEWIMGRALSDWLRWPDYAW